MNAIGIDIIEIARLEKAIARHGEDFLERLYTADELKLYRDKLPSLAGRFAAKEAVIKALGETSGASLKDIEILADDRGKPLVKLHGKARKRAQALGLAEIAVSLSHSREYAVAVASGERPE
ncbi:MAG: holo-ACP synthase [Dehalococcoidia bacterium]|jgi:holo-[acyl-carrier protein] synthase